MFGRAWMREAGLNAEQLGRANQGIVFGLSFVLALVASAVFALFLGPRPALPFAIGAGASAGLCWVAASFGINYLFERKSFRLLAINGGYHTVQFTLYGLILGLWN
jgi:hypothetical protein